MTEYRKNGYDDDDMRQIVEAIEKLEGEKLKERASAAGKCAKLAEKIKVKKAEAKDVGIPTSILSATLKRRRLERQIKAIDETIDEELVEVWEDAAGQFCMFSPVEREDDEDAEADDTPADEPARTAADDAAEQAEGEKTLEAVH